MFNLAGNASLRGSGHLILNMLRAFTVIVLLCISASCWVMVVMTGKNGSFFFFDAISQIFASSIAIFLIVSETGIFRKFYQRNWPVFSARCGLTWLGSALSMLSCHVLGELNRPQLSQDAIGMPLWRLILASGILGLVFGMLNVVASLVFRDGENGINARNIRSDGSLAGVTPTTYAGSYASSTRSDNSIHHEKVSAAKRWTQKLSPFNGGSRPKISPPIQNYNNNDIEIPEPQSPMPPHNHQYDYNSDVEAYADSGISHDRRSPVMPDITRPETALHPMNSTNNRVSRYSVVSHINRF